MSHPEKTQSGKSLSERLRAARERQDLMAGKRSGSGAGAGFGKAGNPMALGFRIVVEMLAALGVGIGIGILLDRWLGTTPWLMILFFFLGAGAAFMNVIRVAKAYEARAAAGSKAEAGDRGRSPRDGGEG